MNSIVHQIFTAFLRVVERPRHGLTVGPVTEKKPDKHLPAFLSATVTLEGETLEITANLVGQMVFITCWDSKFRFIGKFRIDHPQPVRQNALVFVEKLKRKHVYDVMML